jgi:hypothetical protein
MSDGTDELSGRIEAHPGTPIIRAYNACEAARDVFEVSALQLRRFVLSLEDPADPLGVHSVEGLPALEGSRPEIFRRLFKLIGAVEALVQRTRDAMNGEFVDECRRQEHEHAIDAAFESDPLTQFLRGLREYVRQRGEPALNIARYQPPAPSQLGLYLDAMAMLSWERWNSHARRYLHQHQPRLPLLGMMDSYEQKARTFRHRFAARFREEHRSKIDAVLALMAAR